MHAHNPFFIDPDITKAFTLPSQVYTDPSLLILQKNTVFKHSWQWLGGCEWQNKSCNLNPAEFIPGFLPEPMLIVKSGDQFQCLSNVCTHRAKILIEEPTQKNIISCRYHGRCFHIDGQFKSMPEFQDAKDFPTEKDNLTKYFIESWNGFFFCGLCPKTPL